MVNLKKGLLLWENALNGICNNNATHKTQMIINNNLKGNNEFGLICEDCKIFFPLRSDNLRECVEEWIKYNEH